VQDVEEGKWAIGDDPFKASNIDHDGKGPGTRTWIYLVGAEPVGPGANITLKDGLNVTTVSNPESRDDHRHRDSPKIHGLMECPVGRDLWPNVKE
jgi:hypothetical protein